MCQRTVTMLPNCRAIIFNMEFGGVSEIIIEVFLFRRIYIFKELISISELSHEWNFFLDQTEENDLGILIPLCYFWCKKNMLREICSLTFTRFQFSFPSNLIFRTKNRRKKFPLSWHFQFDFIKLRSIQSYALDDDRHLRWWYNVLKIANT